MVLTLQKHCEQSALGESWSRSVHHGYDARSATLFRLKAALFVAEDLEDRDYQTLGASLRNKAGGAGIALKMRYHAGLEKIGRIDLDDQQRHSKIRHAAAVALEELQLFRAAGPITPEALDAEVERISQQISRSYGCELAVQRDGDGITHFMIQLQHPNITCDLVENFFHHNHQYARDCGERPEPAGSRQNHLDVAETINLPADLR